MSDFEIITIKNSRKDQPKASAAQDTDLNKVSGVPSNLFCLLEKEKCESLNDMSKNDGDNIATNNLEIDAKNECCILIDDDEDESEAPHPKAVTEQGVVQSRQFLRSRTAFGATAEPLVQDLANKDGALGSESPMDVEVMQSSDNAKQVQCGFHIRRETSLPTIVTQPGDRCFSGGLVGPDGTTWHLGKWCKKAPNKGLSAGSQGIPATNGDLIAVGADGRGGKIKVLKSLNHSSSDNKETSMFGKRCKNGSKASNAQSQGCLQIEHFFGKSSQQ